MSQPENLSKDMLKYLLKPENVAIATGRKGQGMSHCCVWFERYLDHKKQVIP